MTVALNVVHSLFQYCQFDCLFSFCGLYCALGNPHPIPDKLLHAVHPCCIHWVGTYLSFSNQLCQSHTHTLTHKRRVSMASFQAVAYEYAIEMTYPLAEGTSSGLVNLGSQVSVWL